MPKVKKVTTKPLRFENHFRTIGKKYPHGEKFVLKMPMGVPSVEAAEKQRDLAHRIERYNAKIYTDEEQKLRALYKLAKEQKKKVTTDKLMQYMSTARDAQGNPYKVPQALAADLARYMEEHGQEQLQPLMMGSGFRTLMRVNTGGMFNYTPTKHLVHRVKQMNKGNDIAIPESQVKTQDDELDQRQNMFRQLYIFRHGRPPKQEDVDDAVPEKAEPIYFSPYRRRFHRFD